MHYSSSNVLKTEECPNKFYWKTCTLKLQVVHIYEGHKADIHLLQPFGDHVISVDVDNVLIVWDVQSEGERLFCYSVSIQTVSRRWFNFTVGNIGTLKLKCWSCSRLSEWTATPTQRSTGFSGDYKGAEVHSCSVSVFCYHFFFVEALIKHLWYNESSKNFLNTYCAACSLKTVLFDLSKRKRSRATNTLLVFF